MPYDDPDTTDPLALHGVEFETQGDEAMREMAECFAQEYLRSGFGAGRIMKMFQTRGYAGPFLAYQRLGENEIKRIVDELVPLWAGRSDAPVSDVAGKIRLPILES